MITSTEQSLQQQSMMTGKRRKKCHGRRKEQRFRKQCRRRGMKPATIARKVKERFGPHKSQTCSITNASTTVSHVNNTLPMNMEIHGNLIVSNKRKRETLRSLSQHSLSQSARPNKMKNKCFTMTSPIIVHNNVYREASYLKLSSRLLLHALCLQPDETFKTKSEQHFVYSRLKLLDQHFSLDLHRFLWQSYFDLGSKQQLWTNELYAMAKTNEPQLCQQFVEKYLIDIQNQLDRCNATLTAQSTSCPKTLSIIKIDRRLNEFVRLQQKQFSNKIGYQLARFKQEIGEKHLESQLFNCPMTSDQSKAIHRIVQLREIQLQAWREIVILEQRILSKFLPENFDHFEKFIAPDFYSPVLNDKHSLEYHLKRYKIIQDAKRLWLGLHVELQIFNTRKYDQQYLQELTQFQLSYGSPTHTNKTSLFHIVQIYIKQRTDRIKEEIFLQMSYFRVALSHRRQRATSAKQMVGVSPEAILNANNHSLTDTELEYLSRNGLYIRKNRTALRSYAERVKFIQEEHDDMMEKSKKYLPEKCGIPSGAVVYKQFSKRIQDCLMHHYMTPLSFLNQISAKRDLTIMKSIRRKLKAGKLFLRETDKGGNLYVGNVSYFEDKASEYREETGAYEELPSSPIEDILLKVTRLLNDLQRNKQITKKQLDKMMPHRSTVELPYIYYNPKTHKDPITVRPITNTIHAPTSKISRFLDRLIRPLFDYHAEPRPIIDGVHLLRQLQQYVKDGRLKPTTLFCIFDINNLSTMLPQDEALDVLEEFLREHHYEKVQGISIATIRQLAEIVLKEAAFVDGKKFYKQIVGGAMGSPFTLTLANIFMWKWEKHAIYGELGPIEIYGRYIDDIFFTSNESETKIRAILEKANNYHPNIKFKAIIASSVPFLDLLISNNNGLLSTSVYHKPAAEPCVVPFISDHPRHVFSDVIQAALLRAVRYSSTLEIFEKERRAIRLMLLFNGYPIRYIDTYFRKFFAENISISSVTPLIDDENQFFTMRNKLLALPSVRELQVDNRMSSAGLKVKPEQSQQR